MNEFLIGGIIGATQTLFGHPLDTIKVRIQNNQKWKNMKPRHYYKGSLYPLSGSLVFNMIVFPTYEKTVKHTKSPIISGFLSGLCVSPFIYMFDVGKIKRQANTKLKINDFIKTRGKFTNTIRETIANTIYFGGYFYCKNDLNLSPLVSGGIAGLLNWTLTYPIDVLRTRQIAQNISIKKAIKQGKLWRGYSPCAIRAIIVNSLSFYVYEYCKSF
jgi:hypothetical protein